MSDTLDLYIADARSELNQISTGGNFSDHELTKWANRAQQIMASRIMEADQGYFEESDQSLGFIADQEEYDLPQLLLHRRITKITRTDLSERVPIDYIRFQERDHYQPTGVFYTGGQTDGRYYYLRGNKLGLKPTPKSTIAANILIHYLQLPHDMYYGDVGATVTTTAFVLPTATSGSAPVAHGGRVSTRPSYYVNARIRMIEGTNLGLEEKITAYNEATRTATVTPAWTVANVENKNFVILSQLKDEYQQGFVHYMVMKGAKKKSDWPLYRAAKEEFTEVIELIDRDVSPRHTDENVHVRPPGDWDLD